MQASEKEVMTRELEGILGAAAGMLYIAGLTNRDICDVVTRYTRMAAEEQERDAQTTKDQGGN